MDTIQKQIKFAVVMYGGVSLAIYINGIAQEMLKMVQSTAENSADFPATAEIYRKIALILSDENLLTDLQSKEKIKEDLKNINCQAKPNVRFVIDVLSGSSAGGINAIFLAKALANDLQMDGLKNLWLREGDIAKLLNDKKSVSGTELNANEEPSSLLNGQRMYLKLLEALCGMDENGRDKNFKSPNVEELDLFVTYTDFGGVPLPIQLSDKLVFERKHKQVFNFRYVKDDAEIAEPNQFLPEYNPFLAFAARCTSAFPFAFEPMKLTNIDEVIENCHPEFKTENSENEQRKNFFRAAVDKNGNEIIWKNRWLVDGGYLDNKPFGFAIDTISKRQTTEIIERKLLYIDPFPETFGNEKEKPEPPDVIQNLLAAAMDLPRYETIREDLQRVLERNRLIERVNFLIAQYEDDFDKASEILAKPSKDPKDVKDWSDKWLNEIVEYKGESFLPYYRLRVIAVTDDITKIIARKFKIDEDSSYFRALRSLIRVWRDENYAAYEEAGKQPYNKFLSEFDLDYRLRRLHYILRKTEFLLRDKGQTLQKPNDSKKDELIKQCRDLQQGSPSNEATLKYAADETGFDYQKGNFVETVNYFRQILKDEYKKLRRYQEKLLSSENLIKLPKSLEEKITKDELDKILKAFEETNQGAMAGNNESADFKAAKKLYDRVKPDIDQAGKGLSALHEQKVAKTREQMRKLLNLDDKNKSTDETHNFIAEYLKTFYILFDSHDQISFPIYYQTPVGEAVPVDVVRISPRDAISLIDEETDQNKRQKLAGVSLFAFGGFLDEGWRQNDIMWGRLDAAERLIQTLLPGDKYQILREVLVEQANNIILTDELLGHSQAKLKENFVQALVQSKCEAGEQGAIGKILANLEDGKLKTGLNTVLQGCFDENGVQTVFQKDYQFNNQLEPQPLLKTVSRSTQITGKILQGVSEKYGQNGGSLSWISRLGYIFFGLVEVAAPNSAWNLFITYWLKLLYFFEVLLIVGGTLLVSTPIQQFGIVAFALTAAVHLAVLTLHDAMNGTNFLKLLKTVAVFLILALALVGFFALYVFLYADESLISFLRNARKTLTDFSQFKSLLPVAALAISLVGLLIWREVRKKNIRFFGWTIVISSILFLTFIFTIFQSTFKDAHGIGGLPPVLSLEFINNVSDVSRIAPKPEIRESLQKAMWLDSFVIVPFYVSMFLLMSQLLALANKSWLKNKLFGVSQGKVLALIAAICSVLGGLGDCVENYFSHWILSLSDTELQSNAWLVTAISWPSHLKFGLIFFAVIILSLIFWRFEGNVWRSAFQQFPQKNGYELSRLISLTLLGLILLIFGIFGIYGIVWHNYHFAQVAMNGAFLAPILAGILFIWLHRDFLKDF